MQLLPNGRAAAVLGNLHDNGDGGVAMQHGDPIGPEIMPNGPPNWDVSRLVHRMRPVLIAIQLEIPAGSGNFQCALSENSLSGRGFTTEVGGVDGAAVDALTNDQFVAWVKKVKSWPPSISVPHKDELRGILRAQAKNAARAAANPAPAAVAAWDAAWEGGAGAAWDAAFVAQFENTYVPVQCGQPGATFSAITTVGQRHNCAAGDPCEQWGDQVLDHDTLFPDVGRPRTAAGGHYASWAEYCDAVTWENHPWPQHHGMSPMPGGGGGGGLGHGAILGAVAVGAVALFWAARAVFGI